MRKVAGCTCTGNAGNVFPATDKIKPTVSDPSMHHGTCITHVPWCMSGSLTRGGGENIGILGACATRNFTNLARGPWYKSPLWYSFYKVFWSMYMELPSNIGAIVTDIIIDLRKWVADWWRLDGLAFNPLEPNEGIMWSIMVPMRNGDDKGASIWPVYQFLCAIFPLSTMNKYFLFKPQNYKKNTNRFQSKYVDKLRRLDRVQVNV